MPAAALAAAAPSMEKDVAAEAPSTEEEVTSAAATADRALAVHSGAPKFSAMSALAATFVFAFLSYAANADTSVPPSVYVHQFSKMQFPPSVGMFTRGTFNRFDAEGRDISVGYNVQVPGHPIAIAMTVYVYPAPGKSGSEAGEFESVKNEIAVKHFGAQPLLQDNVVLDQTGGPIKGRHAVYRFSQLTAGGDADMGSEAYLFMRGGWFFMYRVSYLYQGRDQVAKPIRLFMEFLRWPPG
jgi:hypothetical protein